jgi:hypothetical protein
MYVQPAAMRVHHLHISIHPFDGCSIARLVQQPYRGNLPYVLPASGATICGAPGRCDQSVKRVRDTKIARPTFASRKIIIPHTPIFII